MKDDAARFQPIPGYTNLVLDTVENRNVHLDVFGRPMVPDDAPLKTFEFIPFDQIKIETAPAYLVKGLVPRVGLCVFWGPPKCGKSFLVLDLTLHVALGWKYRGRKVRKGAVVYCALEGCTAFKNRIEAFRQDKLAEDVASVPFHLMASPLQLVADHPALVASITAKEPNPAVVVIDTLNRSLTGSESSDADMTAYVQAADAIRDAFNCAVIIVHHCGHEGTRPRGHSSLMGALDAQIAVKHDDDKNIIATIELMKDGTQGDELTSRLKVVELGINDEGDMITSCVIEATNAPVHAPKAAKLAGISPLYRSAYDFLADGVKQVPGHNAIPVRKVLATAVRDELKSQGLLDCDDNGVLTAKGRKQVYDAKIGLIKAGIIVEKDGYVWRIK